MPITSPVQSIWQQLKRGQITCEQALKLLKDEQGMLNAELLDKEVCTRFFQTFPGQKTPSVIPLLLWRNCYYLGSPVPLSEEIVQKLRDRTRTDIRRERQKVGESLKTRSLPFPEADRLMQP